MKNTFLLIVALIAGAGIAAAQESSPAAEAKVVTIGTIGKLDPKTKTVTLTFATSMTIEPPTETNAGTGRGGGGGGGGGGRGGGGGGRGGGGRGGGGGGRGGGGGGGGGQQSAPSSGNSGSRASTTLSDHKVLFSSATVLKEGDKEIHFADLKVGDTLQVMSAKGGGKIDAIEVTRFPKEAPDAK